MFACLVAPHSVLVLFYGLTGSSGNSLVTGAFLATATVAVGLLCFRRDIVLLPADYLFLALLLCILSSSAFNGWTSNVKEYELIVLSLAAYPACRFISRADIAAGRGAFIWATGVVVALGSVATAAALWQQWDDQHGKPFVFGFDAAGTYFLGSLCFLIIALVTSGGLTLRRTAIVSSLIFLPTAIFAASLVRFTFIALAGTLCLAAVLSEARQRKHVVVIAFVLLAAIAAGLLARYDQARLFADYAIERSPGEIGLEKPPSCYLTVNPRNSIAIRKVLVQDALFLIPRSGWIGTGLDSFMKFSCIKLTEVHNSVLQAAVEFGWLGGSLLSRPYCRRRRFAVSAGEVRRCVEVRAVRPCLLWSCKSRAWSYQPGRRSLFALLGCAVGLRETSRAAAPARSAVVA